MFLFNRTRVWNSVLFSILVSLVGAFAHGVPQGGTFTFNLGAEPTTLNPITATDGYAQAVQDRIVEPLLVTNPNTYEFEAGLAEKWEISKDGKVFTFHIRPDAKFHDNTPVTVEDVKFSFDYIFDTRFKAAPKRAIFEGVEKCEIVDPHTVRFTAKEKLFVNLENIAGLIRVIPKHIYGDPEKKGLNKTVIGSGPYKLSSYDQGKRIVLERNTEWWGNKEALKRGDFNFEKIVFRFVQEKNIALEMIQKGELDSLGLAPEDYIKKTTGPEWGKSVIKVKTENSAPKSYGFIAWNFENPILKDKQVRIALAHLMNRRLMNEKFRFGMSELATGPWHYQSEYASKKVKPLEYDPKLALEILKKDGWSDSDKTGVLTKVIDGKKTPLSFGLMNAGADSMKYFTMFKEDAKQIGVQVDLKLVEWNTFIKLLDEGKFDSLAMAWGDGSVNIDPKQIWHSSSSGKGGSNFIHYKNNEVDKLIMQARATFEKKKRITILQKAYELIAADAPYSFLFNDRYELYAHTARIKTPKDTFKYDLGTTYWWTEK